MTRTSTGPSAPLSAAPPELIVLQSIRELRTTTNPYVVQLVRDLAATDGLRVVTFSWRTALLGRWDVLHVHWPELVVRRGSRARTAAGMVLLLVLLLRVRLGRKALVRTVHNVTPHEPGLPGEAALLALLDRWTTTAVVLDEAVRPRGSTPTTLIPHGDYTQWFAAHEVPASVPGRLLTFGLIRPYKGVERLGSAFAALTDPAATLAVVGRPINEAMAAEVRAIAEADPRVSVALGHADDAALAASIGQAELVVLPYTTMANSGAVLLALSLGRPVLVADNPLNRGLAAEVGPGWVHLFSGEIDVDDLTRALAAVREGGRAAHPDLSRRTWDVVTAAHRDAYVAAAARAARAGRGDADGPLRIALVGTRGVPARYGGFETAVEEVGRRLAARGHDVVVYCRSTDGDASPAAEHLGMRLVHLPALRHRALETLSHTGFSVAHLVTHRVDAAIVFNAANAPWLPLVRAARIPVATHVDGLEWKRAKWGNGGRRYYRLAEALSVRWSDALIADAQGIADYYTEEFRVPSELIAYGAPIVGPADDRLVELDLTSGGYHLVVARFEPENHVEPIVAGYVRSGARLPLVVVGSAPYADAYIASVRAAADDRVRFLGGVWDQELLDQLYANARTYLHGHSVGGTNPSLLRAIGAGAPTIAFDVSFNREVLGDDGRYFTGAHDVAPALEEAEADLAASRARGEALRRRATRYDWDDVALGYERLVRSLAGRELRRPRGAGRRYAP